MAGEIPDSHKAELEKLRKEHGLGYELYHSMNMLKSKWKKDKIRVALVGASRIGKSSHINAHLRQRSAAPVSATSQCTRETKCYPHPDNACLLLYDSPGFNTLDYHRQNYDEFVKVEDFDFFLSLTSNIFTDDVLWLSNKITGLGKRHYIVRTEIDKSVNNALESGEAESKAEALEQVRASLLSDMKRSGLDDPSRFKIYMVDNNFWFRDPPTDPFEFDDLSKDLTNDSFAELQQDALMHTISKMLVEMFGREKKDISSWIWKISGTSAVGALIPVPGPSLCLDIGIVVTAVVRFYDRVGLTKQSVKELETLYSLNEGALESDLQNLLREKYPLHHAIREEQIDAESVKAAGFKIGTRLAAILVPMLGVIAGSEVVEDTVKVAVPIIGLGIAAALSYITTTAQLKILQKEMEKIADYAIQLPALRK